MSSESTTDLPTTIIPSTYTPSVEPLIDKDGPLLVIGAGIGRTGTRSLKLALEILYGQPCYHGSDLIEKRHDQYKPWIELDQQLSNEGQIDQDRFKDIYKGYRCAVDLPTCCYYEHLMKIYPDAKVILSIRDSKDWVRSVRRTILPRRPPEGIDWSEHLMQRLVLGWEIRTLLRTVWVRCFGSTCDFNDDLTILDAFEAWNQRVRETVPADRLLVMEAKEGWEPLCRFLDLPIPQVAYPGVNQWQIINSSNSRMKDLAKWIRWGIPLFTAFGLGIFVQLYGSGILKRTEALFASFQLRMD